MKRPFKLVTPDRLQIYEGGGCLRSRRGATIIEISKQGLRIRQRGAWTTRTTASLDAADILDVDYTSRESTIASATRATEQKIMQSYPDHAEDAGPRVERLVTALTRFVKNKGLTIKSRKGLTMVGQGLDDEEIRYHLPAFGYFAISCVASCGSL